MADEVTPHGDEGAEGQETPENGGTDWKAEARKWEQRAKGNADAARRLSELENANKTAEQQNTERIAVLEKQLADAQRESLLRRVQASHGVSDEDAALFLTGEDEKTLTAQAKRLAERSAVTPGAAPREGTPRNSSSDEPMREFVRGLFNSEE